MKLNVRISLGMLFCLLFLTSGAWAQGVEAAASKAVVAHKKLLSAQIKDDMDTDVDEPTRKLLRDFKDALVDASDAMMSDESARTAAPQQVSERLRKMLDAISPEEAAKQAEAAAQNFHATQEQDKNKDDLSGFYGGGFQLSATTPEDWPQLMEIEFGFDIPCGVDSMLLVYELKDGAWRRALSYRSDDYEEISGAVGDFFEHKILPIDDRGAWGLLAAHGTPWCTSRFSAFALDVQKPTGDGKAQSLLHTRESFDRTSDLAVKMRVRPDGFEFRAPQPSSDIDVFEHMTVYRYKRDGEGFHRVQPAAMNARDFVDIWLDLDWPLAMEWSAAEHREALRAMRKRFARESKNDPEPMYAGATTHFGAVRACKGDAQRFQVELNNDEGKPWMYFRMRGLGYGFEMLEISAKPDALCSGSDLMKKAAKPTAQ